MSENDNFYLKNTNKQRLNLIYVCLFVFFFFFLLSFFLNPLPYIIVEIQIQDIANQIYLRYGNLNS